MGGLSTRGRRTTGITGPGIVLHLLDIVRMGRTSLVIARRQIMAVVLRIPEMEAGRLGTAVGLDHLEMGMADDRLGMVTELGLLVMEMEAGLGHRGTVVALGRPGMEVILEVELGRLAMGEAAGLQLLLLGLHQHHVLRLLLVPRQRLGQCLLLGRHQVVLLREDLIPGIRKVARSRRNGLSRLARGRVDSVEITMAPRRGKRVIAAKPALVAVGVREVNRNEAFQV
jgi:hypothetical protein